VPVEQQVLIIYAVTTGFLDDVPVPEIRGWESGFLQFMAASHPDVAEEIRTRKTLSDDLKARLDGAMKEYKQLGAK
jgi:F-type H+-transporting ATPase subunit alpha